MLKYAQIPGMIADENLATFIPSEMDKKIGNIPNWLILLDPEYTKDATILNRCTGYDCPDIDGSPQVPVVINENDYKLMRYLNGDNPRIQCDAILPSDQITVFGIIRPTIKSSTNRFTIITSNSAIEPIPQLNFGFTGDLTTLVVSTRGNTNPHNDSYTRVKYIPANTFKDRLVYIMMTFSTSNGLVLYENGVKVAENRLDTREFVLSDTTDLYSMLRGICGDVGICGVVGTDLSLTKNKDYKLALDQFIKKKYSL
ncbi:hypothetical protein [Acinetobacter soli]|uniref:hypothetical protein n=1 Tax=Acinetobacter soli TaxID=487316 RepID=UPI001250C9D4|nr:hypothetical protein [Acinetobacter soli]